LISRKHESSTHLVDDDAGFYLILPENLQVKVMGKIPLISQEFHDPHTSDIPFNDALHRLPARLFPVIPA
jgi:hypothetical protein